jgi:hypothetical protein
MDIKLTAEDVKEIREVLEVIANRLDSCVEDYESSEGVNDNLPATMDELLQNPMARSIYEMSRVSEILDLAEIRTA